jgi:hypothetical protein
VSALNQRDLGWRRSSASNSECIEVTSSDGYILVRDSKAAAGPVLMFSHLAWASFAWAVSDSGLISARIRYDGSQTVTEGVRHGAR